MLDSGKELNSSGKVGLFKQSLIYIILPNQFFLLQKMEELKIVTPKWSSPFLKVYFLHSDCYQIKSSQINEKTNNQTKRDGRIKLK